MNAKLQFTTCVLCDEPLNESPSWGSLFQNRFTRSKCNRCASQFVRLEEEVDGVFCLFEYNEAMRQYFRRLKFMKDVYCVYAFHQEIHKVLETYVKQMDTEIIPIPMHEENLMERTFAHVDELLRAAQIPFHQALIKTTCEQQSKKTRSERLAVKKLFTVKNDVSAKHLVVFDDIKTTGVTLRLAKEALLNAGAKEVTLIALAGGLPQLASN